MQRPTHVIGGAAAGVLLAACLSLTTIQAIAGICLATVCGFLPDQIQWSSKSIEWKFVEGHRGFSHHLWFAIATGLLLGAFHPAAGLFAFVGLLSHYLLDLPGDMGIPLFWPIVRRRIALGLFNNGGRGEFITRMLLVALIAVLIVR